jgi:aldehyde dehydrogenase
MEMTEDLIRNVIQQVLSQMGTGTNGSSPKPSGKDGVYPTADAGRAVHPRHLRFAGR